MNLFRELRREDGFTIQEILVVLIVSSLLVSFGLSLYQFTSKLVINWGKKRDAHNVANGVTQRIALDVQRAGNVQTVSDSTLVLASGIGRQVVFHFGDTCVWRNGVQIGEALRGHLLMKVTPGQNHRAFLGGIDIIAEATSQATTARAAALVSVPWSSRQEFTRSLEGLNWNAAGSKH